MLAAVALLPWVRTASTAPATLRVLVGFAAGGPSDAVARAVAASLLRARGTPVQVENRPGAGARLAIEQARGAAPDGSLVLLVPDATMTLYPHVYRSLTYDPARDFTPVAHLVSMSMAMFVGPLVPVQVKTLADYVEWVRADAGRSVYGTTAAGATPHFLGAMFARAAGLSMSPVHYGGGAPAMRDLIGGHLPTLFGSVADGMPHTHTGALRVLATSGEARAEAFPAVPTFVESGYKELVVNDGLGVYLPGRAVASVVDHWSEALTHATSLPPVADALRAWGFKPLIEGASEFRARLQREHLRWGQVAAATGFVVID